MLVVAEHHHDAQEGVYRLVIGETVEHEQIVTDMDGQPVFDEETGAVKTEMVAEIVPLADVVFADDDKRWRNRKPETIAATQRQIVAESLAARENEAAAPPAPAVVQLPGIGQSLAQT